ncbi:MAG: signal peptidase II [bacterium]|nr:signal peptidase II [bacterium]
MPVPDGRSDIWDIPSASGGAATCLTKDMNHIKKHSLVIVLMIIILILDQITKSLAQTNLTPNKIVWLLKGIIGLNYRTNYGLNFGLGSNWRFIYPIKISGLTILLFIPFAYYIKLFPYLTNLLKAFFAFFMASHLGDLLELFLTGGYRRDWLQLFQPITTNLTDIYLFVSFALLLVGLIKHPNIGWEKTKKHLSRLSMKDAFSPFRNDKKT